MGCRGNDLEVNSDGRSIGGARDGGPKSGALVEICAPTSALNAGVWRTFAASRVHDSVREEADLLVTGDPLARIRARGSELRPNTSLEQSHLSSERPPAGRSPAASPPPPSASTRNADAGHPCVSLSRFVPKVLERRLPKQFLQGNCPCNFRCSNPSRCPPRLSVVPALPMPARSDFQDMWKSNVRKSLG